MEKKCPSCGETKAASEFGRNRTLGDGLSFYCLPCNRERNNAHYRKRRAAVGRDVRDLSWVPEGFRWCPTCQEAVLLEDYVRNSAAKSGFGTRCKPCHNRTSKAAYWVRRYGISRDDVDRVRAQQHDRCAICGTEGPEHLDHDHDSGKIRQLLCQRCNHGLGLFRDDPTILRGAADYVEHHRGPAVAVAAAPSTPLRRSHPAPDSARLELRSRAAGCRTHDVVRARLAYLIASLGSPADD